MTTLGFFAILLVVSFCGVTGAELYSGLKKEK